MQEPTFKIRPARAEEHATIGELMVQVYSSLAGFPKPEEQPAYYRLLENVGELTQKPGIEILLAVSADEAILGAVVYIGDMQHYGSGGRAPQEKNAAGFRLLAVDPQARGQGVGKALSQACIAKAREQAREQLIIHTTQAMQTAWAMYEALGFARAPELDFQQGELTVYGFRLTL